MTSEAVHNSALAEELDAYGGHLPVYIESPDGNLYQVGEVISSTRVDGVAVILVMGDRVTDAELTAENA